MLSSKTTTLTPNFAIEQSYEFYYNTKFFIYTRICIIVYPQPVPKKVSLVKVKRWSCMSEFS